jgi:hypothetical protein
MEYLIGSVVTLIAFLVVSKNLSRHKLDSPPDFRVRYTQSYIQDLVGPARELLALLPVPRKPSQSIEHHEKSHVRVVFSEGKAYWIANNTFYEAEMIDGIVQNEIAKAVDIMGMNKVQLDKMMFIVEKLTEGLSNDSGSPGK